MTLAAAAAAAAAAAGDLVLVDTSSVGHSTADTRKEQKASNVN